MGPYWLHVVRTPAILFVGLVSYSFWNAGADNVVKIWNPFTGFLIRDLNGHTAGNSDIAWSPDGVFLASASDDTSIRIWDVDSVCTSMLLHITFILLTIDEPGRA